MVLRALDPRLRELVERSAESGHRALVVLVGDEGRSQVPLLHHLVSKTRLQRPSVLWCFKKDLGFASSRHQGNKKMKAWKKKVGGSAPDERESGGGSGSAGVDGQESFQMFLAATSIRYCFYKDTHRILGQTYGMCILQDFEALTPNLMARTIETVDGGGMIVFLLKSMASLKNLYTLNMDVHSRLRTESQKDIIPRFNERFLLSLTNAPSCLVMDENLNVLPVTNSILAHSSRKKQGNSTEDKLQALKQKFVETQPTGSLLNLCKTSDQAMALLEFIDAITDKKLDRTVSLTAGRGRGKSATQGLAIAAAIAFGYTNIFVTSPSPENLHTLFEFVLKGFDAMEYEEHTDYDVSQSTNPGFNSAVVRISVHEKNHHRQTIQYIHPSDSAKLGQAELVVIDEAGAIPLPYVQKLVGPYLVFLSSTINGYEGTGRSLSLKLIKQLRKQNGEPGTIDKTSLINRRTLKELELQESIRYRNGDPVEMWLHKLLCLDASTAQNFATKTLLPEKCDLYYVNRDTLFSYHQASETFLQRIISLFVSSHYKNSPNDLQILSDAPAHHIFCLLGPTEEGDGTLPEVLCAIQVCLEGSISKESIMNGLSRGKRASGDLIPWTMAQQYQDDNFPSLSGARIVRVATHPSFQRMGFGKRAMTLLQNYYSGTICGEAEDKILPPQRSMNDANDLNEVLAPRDRLPPLLLRLTERKPETLDYLGVSYGLTYELLRFWKSLGYTPMYLRQTPSDLTGEHTVIMLKRLQHSSTSATINDWLCGFWEDFRKRFVNLCNFDFRKFSPSTALSVLSNNGLTSQKDSKVGNLACQVTSVENLITTYDQRRLDLYCNNMADYHLITDLLPALAKLYFTKELGGCSISAMQECILLGCGLQCKSIEDLSTELNLPVSQVLGLFNNTIRKLNKSVANICKASAVETIIPASDVSQVKQPLDDQKKYTIKGSKNEWERALSGGGKSLVSIKSGSKRLMMDQDQCSSKKKNKL